MSSFLLLTFEGKYRVLTAVALASLAAGMAAIGYVRSSSGETPDSAVEKSLIEMEREWAAVCATRYNSARESSRTIFWEQTQKENATQRPKTSRKSPKDRRTNISPDAWIRLKLASSATISRFSMGS